MLTNKIEEYEKRNEVLIINNYDLIQNVENLNKELKNASSKHSNEIDILNDKIFDDQELFKENIEA
jgi:hypothetical protein